MAVHVHSHWTFIGDAGDLLKQSELVMEALLDQEACNHDFTDSAVAADAGRGVMEIESTSTGEDLAHAVATAQSVVRSALHATGISTPDWPTHDQAMSMVMQDFQTEQFS